MHDIIFCSGGESAPTVSLSENHLADLRKSGLSDEQIAACGFLSLTNPCEVARVLHRRRADRLGPCLLIPYFDRSGSMIPVTDFARLKPDVPRASRSSAGRPPTPIKYESPIGSTVRLYFPPGTCTKLADANVPMLITEGEKKAAKADQVGFACVGLGGVEAWSKKRETGPDGKKVGKRELIDDFDSIALNGREISIVFDSDSSQKPQIQRAEWGLAQALTERGAIVKVVRLPNGPPDADGNPTKIGLDDYLASHSADDFRDLLRIAESPKKPQQKDDRTEILVSSNEAVVNDAAIQALASDEQLYQRGGRLVHVARGESRDGIDRPKDAPRVLPIPLAGLRERLTRVIRFAKTVKGELKPAHPPMWCYEAIAARGEWPGIRLLSGAITAPVLRPDGSVLCIPGYDSQTGLLFVSQGIAFPVVEHSSHDDAILAANSLLEIVADFPFASPEHRAAWLAYLLTSLARFAFYGPAPLFLIDANVRGSGKSLLSDVVAIIVTGRDMPRMANPKDDDEARKRITALAIAGDTLVLIDNIYGGLGCPALDAALTATTWKDRILGRSEAVELPLNVTWCATGNNVILHADTSRRVVHIRLDSPLENPEQREGFRHVDLRAYVRENRPILLAHALTILSAYCRAGRPKQHLPAWGSFEGWSDLIRQSLVWCGLPDPGATRAELVERSDCEATAYRDLIAGWDELDPDCFGLTSAEILDRLALQPNRYHRIRDAVAELCPSPTGRLPSSRSLGNKLRHFRGRVVGGSYIDSRLTRRNIAAWVVCRVRDGSAGSDGSAPAAPLHNMAALTRNPYSIAGSAGSDGSAPASPPRNVAAIANASSLSASPSDGSAGSDGSAPAHPSRIAGILPASIPYGAWPEIDPSEPADPATWPLPTTTSRGRRTATDPANPAEPACDEVEVF